MYDYWEDDMFDETSEAIDEAKSILLDAIKSNVKDDYNKIVASNKRLESELSEARHTIAELRDKCEKLTKDLGDKIAFYQSRVGTKSQITMFEKEYEAFEPECTLCHGKKKVLVPFPDGEVREVTCPCVTKEKTYIYWAKPVQLELYRMDDGTLYYEDKSWDGVRLKLFKPKDFYYKTPEEVKANMHLDDTHVWSNERTREACADVVIESIPEAT